MKLIITSIISLSLTFSYGQISVHFHGGAGRPSGLSNKPYDDFNGNISYFGGEIGYEIAHFVGVRSFYNYGQSYVHDGEILFSDGAKGIFREAGIRPWFNLSLHHSSRLSFIMGVPISWYRQEYNWDESVPVGFFGSRHNRGTDIGKFLKYGIEPTLRISLKKVKFIFEGGLTFYGNYMLSSNRKITEGSDYIESESLKYEKGGFIFRLSVGYMF